MADASRIAAPAGGLTLPGSAIVQRIRRLIVVTISAAILYSALLAGSKGGCAGGITASGMFVDQNGDATDVAPTCVNLALRPNPMMFLLFGAILLWAVHRVLRKAPDDASALRILDRAAVITGLLAVAAIVIANVWFALIPLYGIDGSGTYIWPFPFGAVDFQTSPMTSS